MLQIFCKLGYTSVWEISACGQADPIHIIKGKLIISYTSRPNNNRLPYRAFPLTMTSSLALMEG